MKCILIPLFVRVDMLFLILCFLFDSSSFFNEVQAIRDLSNSMQKTKDYLEWQSTVDGNGKHNRTGKIQRHIQNGQLDMDEDGWLSKSKRTKHGENQRWLNKITKPLENLSYESKVTTPFKNLTSPRRIKRYIGMASGIPSGKLFKCQPALSCLNQCGTNSTSVAYKDELTCYCDDHCEYFQDCCQDYTKQCLKDKPSAPSPMNTMRYVPTKPNPRQLDHLKNWTCVEHCIRPNRANGIWMVTSCPNNTIDDDNYFKCTNLSSLDKITFDNYRYSPVYTTNGTVYHNKFCAICNGENVEEMKTYQLSLYCPVTPPIHASQTEQVEFVFKYCSGISWKPPNDAPRRYCLTTIKSKSMCSTFNDPSLLQKCNQGGIGLVNDITCIYKNIHCAFCAGNVWRNLTCGPNILKMDKNKKCRDETGGSPILSSPKALSVLFDFNKLQSMPYIARCSNEKVFDNHLGICRKTLTLPKYSEHNEYKILLWAEYVSDKQSQFKKDEAYSVSLILKRTNKSAIIKDLASSLAVHPRHINNLNINLITFLEIEFDLIESTKKNNSKALVQILNFTSPFQFTLMNFTFEVIRATSRALSCPSFQVYLENEYVPVDNLSAVYIKTTGQMLRQEDYYATGTTTNQSGEIVVCLQKTKCSEKWVLMDEREFTILANRSVFVNASKKMYATSQQFWRNRSLFVCDNFNARHSPNVKDGPVLSMLTVVCMSISIAALLFVLVTYVLFAELRTPPGLNLMNLSAAILLAQVLWLTGSGQTDKPMACTIIALFLHYFFLVSFAWTSIIAFDTWRAFQNSNARIGLANSKRSKRLKLFRYMVIGWGSVLLLVGICGVLDISGVMDMGYASTGVQGCFISDKWSFISFFTVPISLIILLNIVFYTLTMKSINATTTQARVAVDQRDRRQTFGIYLRISSVMGFTWIIGFIAPFVGDFLWYPFIVLNSFQGVYIALAFGLNQRVRNLYKNRFPCHRYKSEDSKKSGRNDDRLNSDQTQDVNVETKL